jgi:hypothetical protein
MLENITNYKNTNDWFYLITAVLVVDFVVILLSKYPGNSPYINVNALDKWYNKFGIFAIASDVLSILLGLAITRYIYTALDLKNPLYFLAILVLVQLIHDIFFYLAIIIKLPSGHNEMIDVFKEYAVEAGAKILGADALMMIFSALIASLLKSSSDHVTSFVALLISYALCYIIYTPRYRLVHKLSTPKGY